MPAHPAAGAGAFTAIVAAMPEEMAPFRTRVTDAHRVKAAPTVELVTARLDGRPVALAVTGDGDRHAREGIAAVLRAIPVKAVIAIGVAGALCPDIDARTLVVSERVRLHPGGETFLADRALVEAAVRCSSARRAVVVTSPRIADTVAEKQHLLEVAQADGLAAVVDLESAAFACAAAEAGIPWIILRAVSDTADEALPPLLNRCRDEGGAVRRGKVALELLGDPRALPLLLSLRHRVRDCAEILGDATQAVLRGLPRGGSGTATTLSPPALRSQGGV